MRFLDLELMLKLFRCLWLPGVRNESMLGVRNVTKDVLSWREFGDDVIVLYLDCGGGYTC